MEYVAQRPVASHEQPVRAWLVVGILLLGGAVVAVVYAATTSKPAAPPTPEASVVLKTIRGIQWMARSEGEHVVLLTKTRGRWKVVAKGIGGVSCTVIDISEKGGRLMVMVACTGGYRAMTSSKGTLVTIAFTPIPDSPDDSVGDPNPEWNG